MSVSWMERIKSFFGYEAPAAKNHSMTEVLQSYIPGIPEVKPELSEFDKIKAKFNPATDMIVMSYDKSATLNSDQLEWLNSLGKRVYYFDTDLLINTAIIRSY